MNVKTLGAALTALTLLATTPAIAAQDYPNKPVRIIANPAGGISDVIARAFAQILQEQWKQPIVIENRPGGSSHAVPRACAASDPDGYTLCMVYSDSMTYFPQVFKKLPYREEDLQPVTNLYHFLITMAVHAKLDARSMDDLIAMSKAQPGKFNYTNNNYAVTYFMDGLVKQQGADWVRVPSRGSPDAIQALLSGTSQIAILGEGNLAALIKDNQVRPILMVNNIRSQNFPDVPTLADIGYKGPAARTWFGLFVPKGTPRPIIDKVNKDIGAIFNSPAFKSKWLDPGGLVAAIGTPEEFAAEIKDEKEQAGIVVKALGLTMR